MSASDEPVASTSTAQYTATITAAEVRKAVRDRIAESLEVEQECEENGVSFQDDPMAQGRARFRKMMRSIQLDEAARTGPYTPENVPYEVLAVALDFAGQSATETLRAIEADYATLFADYQKCLHESTERLKAQENEREEASQRYITAEKERARLEGLARALQDANKRLKTMTAPKAIPAPDVRSPLVPIAQAPVAPSVAPPVAPPIAQAPIAQTPAAQAPVPGGSRLEPSLAELEAKADREYIKDLERSITSLEGALHKSQLAIQGCKAERLEKTMSSEPKSSVDELVKERLKDVFEQYTLRERYFDCLLRAKSVQLNLAEGKAGQWERSSKDNAAKVVKLEAQIGRIQGKLADVETVLATAKSPKA